MRIRGTVTKGCGKARLIGEDAYRTRYLAAGVLLQRGTLNVRVSDFPGTIESLGAPHFWCDGNNPSLGPIRWWRIRLEHDSLTAPISGYIIRHERSRAPYLEIMSDIRFRDQGVRHGDAVAIEVLTELKKMPGKAKSK